MILLLKTVLYVACVWMLVLAIPIAAAMLGPVLAFGGILFLLKEWNKEYPDE